VFTNEYSNTLMNIILFVCILHLCKQWFGLYISNPAMGLLTLEQAQARLHV